MFPKNSKMANSTSVSGSFISGIRDSLAIPVTLFLLYGSRSILQQTLKALVANFILFASSHLIYTWIISPITNKIFTSNNPILYQIFWLTPTLASAFAWNQHYYIRISSRAYEIFVGKPSNESAVITRISGFIRDMYMTMLLLITFILSIFIRSVPFIGSLGCFLIWCLLVSFTAFNFKWAVQKWTVERRIEYFESRWIYFTGFGMTCFNSKVYRVLYFFSLCRSSTITYCMQCSFP